MSLKFSRVQYVGIGSRTHLLEKAANTSTTGINRTRPAMKNMYKYELIFTNALGSITLPSDVVPFDRPVYFLLSTHHLASKKIPMQTTEDTTTATIPIYLRCISVK